MIVPVEGDVVLLRSFAYGVVHSLLVNALLSFLYMHIFFVVVYPSEFTKQDP